MSLFPLLKDMLEYSPETSETLYLEPVKFRYNLEPVKFRYNFLKRKKQKKIKNFRNLKIIKRN
jgi:hypothetical protein